MPKKNSNYTWEAMIRQGRVKLFVDVNGKPVWAAGRPAKATEELRKHNDYDELVTKALMREHSDDWSMETIREAALIATNTMLPLIKNYGIQQRIEELEKLSPVKRYGMNYQESLETIEGEVDMRIRALKSKLTN